MTDLKYPRELEAIHFAAWEFRSEAECFYLRPVEPEIHLKQPKKQLHGARELYDFVTWMILLMEEILHQSI